MRWQFLFSMLIFIGLLSVSAMAQQSNAINTSPSTTVLNYRYAPLLTEDINTSHIYVGDINDSLTSYPPPALTEQTIFESQQPGVAESGEVSAPVEQNAPVEQGCPATINEPGPIPHNDSPYPLAAKATIDGHSILPAEQSDVIIEFEDFGLLIPRSYNPNQVPNQGHCVCPSPEMRNDNATVPLPPIPRAAKE